MTDPITRPPTRDGLVEAIRGGLIVSCQAPIGSPLRSPAITALMAEAALLGGAAGLRVNGPEDVAAVRAITALPVIGLHKIARHRNVITPTLELAEGLVAAGADIVAVDATVEVFGVELDGFGLIVQSLDAPVMADVSTRREGLRAAELGASIVGTTLSGYTPESPAADDPDLDLVAFLAGEGLTVVAEGRYRSPQAVRRAFDAGATAVVVGGAITDPLSTTRRFVGASPRGAR